MRTKYLVMLHQQTKSYFQHKWKLFNTFLNYTEEDRHFTTGTTEATANVSI